MASEPNVTVKINHRGAFKVFVAGTPIAGVLSVRYDSETRDDGKLHIEIIGSMVEFEVIEEPLGKTVIAPRAA